MRHSNGAILQELIQRAIERKARALLRKHRLDVERFRSHAEKYTVRTGRLAGPPNVNEPPSWAYHPHFNPRYCIKHSRYLSRTIWRKLQEGAYEPVPAVKSEIPKPDGSARVIMAFAIPDAALANVLHKNITQRNANVLSSYSFAYRDDKSVFDAVLHLRRPLSSPKTYVIQYDFSSYFDNISHIFLSDLLFERKLFLLSAAERAAVKAFLTHQYAPNAIYTSGAFERRTVGVPQGSSVSLFLANAAAHDLDLTLEGLNGTFTRFADDVVAITRSYRDATRIAQAFRDHCKAAGLSINYKKSPGIQIFGGSAGREIRHFTIDDDDGSGLETIRHIDYVGHRISEESLSKLRISLPDKAVSRIKRRVSKILHIHLFQHRLGAPGAVSAARFGPGFVDWDMVTAINELRKYIYGGLTRGELQSFLDGTSRLRRVRGLMGFLPLVSDVNQLSQLDGWLLSAIRRAQRERVRMAAAQGITVVRPRERIILDGSWYNFPLIDHDVSVPSFALAWRASRKFSRRYGLSRVSSATYYSRTSGYS